MNRNVYSRRNHTPQSLAPTRIIKEDLFVLLILQSGELFPRCLDVKTHIHFLQKKKIITKPEGPDCTTNKNELAKAERIP